jgi:hypothetical protein
MGHTAGEERDGLALAQGLQKMSPDFSVEAGWSRGTPS